MRLSFDNKVLFEDSAESARLKVLANAGSNVTLTLDDNNGLSNKDYVVVGSPMFPKTEIAQINSEVTAGVSVQVATLVFPHNPNDPIYKLLYNKLRLYSASTEEGEKSLVEEKGIDVEQEYTDFIVSDNASGYYFFAFYNSETSTQSPYSEAFLVTENSTKTRAKIKQFVKLFYKDDLDDEDLQILIESTVEEIFSMRAWSFREAEKEISVTAGSNEYDPETDLEIPDFGTLVSARTETQMLTIISGGMDDILSLNPIVLTPNSIYQYAGLLKIRVNRNETVTLKYLKSTESLLTSGSKTSIRLFSAIAFNILSLLFEGKDEKMSSRFDTRYKRAIKTMMKADRKNIEIKSLKEHCARNSFHLTTPNIS